MSLRRFVSNIKAVVVKTNEPTNEELGVFANGRKILEHGDCYQLREGLGAYIANFDRKKGDIGGKNSYIWDVNI